MVNQFSEVAIKDEKCETGCDRSRNRTLNSGPKKASIVRRKFTSHKQK
jgi:hypothetical protein